MASWWEQSELPVLAQGNLIRQCPIPVVLGSTTPEEFEIDVQNRDVIVVTQSCDLKANKVRSVCVCPVLTLPEMMLRFPKVFPSLKNFEGVRVGTSPSVCLLQSPDGDEDNARCLIVDFRDMYSLSVDYLTRFTLAAGPRPTLLSPWVEHFSQAFARFFMRVGLPSDIPSFK